MECVRRVVKAGNRNQRKVSSPHHRKLVEDLPENLADAITWLQKLLKKAYTLNIEGIRRLKDQFDELYEAHLEKFESQMAKFTSNDEQQAQAFLAAKDILGHLLAVCRYLELIQADKEAARQVARNQSVPSYSKSSSLQAKLTQELREFSAHLSKRTSKPIPK